MYTLKKTNLLRKNRQFQQVYQRGKSYSNRYMALYVFPQQAPGNRVGFAAGKRLGNAVVRNRVKRLLREAYRLQQGRIKEGAQLIVMGRKALVTAQYDVAERALLDLFRKSHLLK